MLPDARTRLLRRAARELHDGMIVNLGIGLPTAVMSYVPHANAVCVHSENGISGMGGPASESSRDRNLIDAGGSYVTPLPGAAYFDSSISFGIIRGRRLDLSLLGAFEVASNGDLANWMIPGHFTPGVGGAMELAQKAKRVVVVTSHIDRKGGSKLVEHCSLPLTAAECVHTIITDMAVIDVTREGFALRELRDGLSIVEVAAATAAPLIVPDTPLPYY